MLVKHQYRELVAVVMFVEHVEIKPATHGDFTSRNGVNSTKHLGMSAETMAKWLGKPWMLPVYSGMRNDWEKPK
jgi:hypothetical protein